MPDVTLDVEKIKRRREQLGLTQDDAGRISGMGSRQAWSQIETGDRGTVNLETLAKIATALQLKAAELLIER